MQNNLLLDEPSSSKISLTITTASAAIVPCKSISLVPLPFLVHRQHRSRIAFSVIT